jgi:hypothetical protein
MLTVTLGIALTLVLTAKAVIASRRNSHDMGTMSPGWVVVNHASEPASSI